MWGVWRVSLGENMLPSPQQASRNVGSRLQQASGQRTSPIYHPTILYITLLVHITLTLHPCCVHYYGYVQRVGIRAFGVRIKCVAGCLSTFGCDNSTLKPPPCVSPSLFVSLPCLSLWSTTPGQEQGWLQFLGVRQHRVVRPQYALGSGSPRSRRVPRRRV